ncbi:MAG: hypothetical protein LBM78_01790 [Clostridiales bacterium]|jgi:hypothetical protein|nr:hypothetical protein [Clostridiales bacterium]
MNNADGKTAGGLMLMIVPEVISLIAKDCAVGELEATARFYRSKVYAALEREETKVWHFSPLTLFYMFKEEQETGDFTFPEEA